MYNLCILVAYFTILQKPLQSVPFMSNNESVNFMFFIKLSVFKLHVLAGKIMHFMQKCKVLEIIHAGANISKLQAKNTKLHINAHYCKSIGRVCIF
jgi:hypothetical protein